MIKEHYVDNERFAEAVGEYAERNRGKDPADREQVPQYVAACFVQIANNLAKHKNFHDYRLEQNGAFLDDMVADAVEAMLKYCTSYDYAKNKNAFAYFTQAAKNAFLQRIEKAHKQLFVRYSEHIETCNYLMDNEGLRLDAQGLEFYRYAVKWCDEHRAKQSAKYQKKKAKRNGRARSKA